MLRRAEIAQARVQLIAEALHERGGKARFADPGLAGKQNHLTFTALRPCPAPEQQFAFFFPPDERREAGSVQRSEVVRDRARPQSRPGQRRSGEPLEVPRSEILKLEEIAEKLSRALGDDHAVGLGDRLQPRREVRRVADDAALLRLSGPEKRLCQSNGGSSALGAARADPSGD